MRTIMTFSALATVTDTVADAIVDAIKTAVARSSAEKAKSENAQDSIVQTKITRTEVLWYLKRALPRRRENRVDEDKLIAKVFEALPEHRVVRFKDGKYAMHGEPIRENNKLIGVMMIAHDEKVKPIEHAEPQI
jgi:hypothetical protein